jgi:hypothetical protein
MTFVCPTATPADKDMQIKQLQAKVADLQTQLSQAQHKVQQQSLQQKKHK